MVRVFHVDYDVVDTEELADGIVYDSPSQSLVRSSSRKLTVVEPVSYSVPSPSPTSFSGGRTLATKERRLL